MTYAVSDFHGRYDLYLALLDKLRMDDDDTLYILGDYLDRGAEGHKIILDIMERGNVIPLIGNHDFTAVSVLSRLNRGVTGEELDELRPLLDAWFSDGGDVTYQALCALSREKRERIFSFVSDMKTYAEVEAGGKKFVLCHAGIKNYKEGLPLEAYDATDFLFTRTDYTKPLFKDKILVTGHTPTALIDGASRGRIFKSEGHIAVDCGAVFGLGLGCICLDNMREYYVYGVE